MKKFTCVQDIGDLKSALAEAFEIKKELLQLQSAHPPQHTESCHQFGNECNGTGYQSRCMEIGN